MAVDDLGWRKITPFLLGKTSFQLMENELCRSVDFKELKDLTSNI